ncbi:VRR-NUC domain-containing protein [Pseudomonas sp. SDO528_S397]
MAIIQPPQIPTSKNECSTTSVKGTVTIGTVAPQNEGYLMEKANYAARFPRVAIKALRNGGFTDVELKQLVMSGLIKADEFRHNFRWDYKAEVSFDMSRKKPIPFLSTSWILKDSNPDPDRRHTMTFFPKGRTSGFLRRPDVIIVKNPEVRWPGTKSTDHDGKSHDDNLERLVEVKFPNDFLSREQRQDYERIAGTKQRFAVLEVSDCRNDEERERDRAYNKEHRPTAAKNPSKWLPALPPLTPGTPTKPAPLPVPAYGPKPSARPAHVEKWTQQVQIAVDSLLEQGAKGIRELSQEVQKHLQDTIIWLENKGKWVRHETKKTWEWISETSGQVMQWTDNQLRSIWLEVTRYTDLTLEMLKEINWAQVLIDLGIAVSVVVIVIAVGAALVSVGVPAALVSGLLLLIRLAAQAWSVLVAILGTAGTAVTGAAASMSGAMIGTTTAMAH